MTESAKWFLSYAGFSAAGAFWVFWFLLFDITHLSWGLVGVMLGCTGFWVLAAAACLLFEWARNKGLRAAP